MANRKVCIIDYGSSNLLSVRRAFEYCGAEVVIADQPSQIMNAEKVVLPGVGAFKDGMDGLRERGLIDAIRSYAETDKPFLGICLGMQMMLDSSEEFGVHQGLGLIPGKVVAIPDKNTDGEPHKIPHIGWNEIHSTINGGPWNGTILEGIPPETSAYFVHSYMAVPANTTHLLAGCKYGNQEISAVLASGKKYGCQFHPEKSGEYGLKMIRNFLKI